MPTLAPSIVQVIGNVIRHGQAEAEKSGMIGLQRGTVRVVPPADEWPALYAEERQRLCERIGHLVLDIQHVGSTAVPGLAAKPIIDIAVAVASPAAVQRCRPLLSELGYIDRGERGRKGGYVFVKERAPEVRTHHLHMVAIDDPQWTSYLRFRDRLRADAVIREEYASLKRKLQERFACDRQGYTKAKDAFIRRVLASDAPDLPLGPGAVPETRLILPPQTVVAS